MIEHLSSRYAVLGHIASGATGELYRARDDRRGREVAVKMLRPEFALDPECAHRLRREARLLASLDHPNVAAVHDFEESEGTLFLIMEYVAGPTLAERVAQGPLPVAEALAIARQLAAGLEAAHGQGVIHRDLKPANIVLGGGQAKILDFGLAKSVLATAPVGDPWEPSSLTQGRTAEGALLGTVGYMSPEQARGLSADRRADIWAFGCILFEMLSGRRAFHGETPTDTLVQILEHAPEWSALPAAVTTDIRHLLHRCLTKDPRFRLRDIGEAWVAIVHALGLGAADDATWDRRPRRPMRRLAAVAGALAILGTALVAGSRIGARGRASAPAVTFELPLPVEARIRGRIGPAIAISPDGSELHWAGWVHRTDSLGFRWGFVGPIDPEVIYSPDGRWLAMRGEGPSLQRLLRADGSVETIAIAPTPRGVAWGPDDSLVYVPGFSSGLWRVSAGGGGLRAVTVLDTARGEVTHRWPDILPDGRGVLFTVRTRYQPSFDRAEIALLDLRTGRRRTILTGGTCARYVASGHIVFARGDRLLAVPFDARRHRLTGTSATVLTGVDVNPSTGAAQFACSRAGILVYSPLPVGGWTNQICWLDRRGRREPVPLPAGLFENPCVSPDRRRVAFTLVGAQNDIAVCDAWGQGFRRVTFDPHEDTWPIWTPDGRRITFASSRGGPLNIFSTSMEGTSQEERLTESPWDQAPTGWSPDGRFLLFTQEEPGTGTDLWLLDLRQPREPRPYIRTPFNERAATVSPCGRWVAYESNETGVGEIYVRAFARADRRLHVSSQGGSDPQWSMDGRELYFARGGDMMVTDVSTRSGFVAGPPRLLFSGVLAVPAATPDPHRFITSTETRVPDRLIVRTGWFEDLRRLAPRSR